jgi:endonuclease G
MEELKHYRGFRTDFLGERTPVRFPRLRSHLRQAVAPINGERHNILHYHNFSLLQHARRRFPIFTAANIDGQLFQTLPREDRWRLDPRIAAEHQWGTELYSAEKSHFDRGHMTKREDVQWGRDAAEAERGADSTFFFTNAVPQVPSLNRQLWRRLEDYILKTETVSRDFRISMLTGPVLANDDPVFVTPVAGQEVRIPTLFWKVIYFTKSDGRLYRVGFLMGQEELLEKEKLVHPRPTSRDFDASEEELLFLQFKDANLYQVNIRTISKLAGLIFTAAAEPYQDDRPVTLIRNEVQARGGFGEADSDLDFLIDGLRL